MKNNLLIITFIFSQWRNIFVLSKRIFPKQNIISVNKLSRLKYSKVLFMLLEIMWFYIIVSVVSGRVDIMIDFMFVFVLLLQFIIPYYLSDIINVQGVHVGVDYYKWTQVKNYRWTKDDNKEECTVLELYIPQRVLGTKHMAFKIYGFKKFEIASKDKSYIDELLKDNIRD